MGRTQSIRNHRSHAGDWERELKAHVGFVDDAATARAFSTMTSDRTRNSTNPANDRRNDKPTVSVSEGSSFQSSGTGSAADATVVVFSGSSLTLRVRIGALLALMRVIDFLWGGR
jgi:hypothetical protein